MISEKRFFSIHQFCGTVMIYCGSFGLSRYGSESDPNKAKNPDFPVLEAALFPKKSASHFYLLTFEFHFMLDP
jgi:hypothetical protein